jgi:GT2 family glycosyltransferase
VDSGPERHRRPDLSNEPDGYHAGLRKKGTPLKTTAVIINWNSGDFLQACVESIVATTPGVDIFVLDNASSDWSMDFLAGGDLARIVGTAKNLGFAGGINEAFSWTKTPYVLILNPDVRVLPGTIHVLEELMDGYPRAGAIGGNVGEKYLPRHFPSLSSLVLENLGVRQARPEVERDLVGVDQVAAAAVIVRREAFLEVDGFDDHFYPAWYEDVDFCLKLKESGWNVYFARKAEFVHAGGHSAAALGKGRFLSIYYKNQTYFARKHFGPLGALAVRISIVVGMIGRIVCRPWQPAGYAKALLGALGGW